MAKIGQISIDLVAYTGKLTQPLRAAQAQVQSFSSGVERMFGGMASKIAALAGGVSVIGLAKYAVQQASAYEDALMAFTTFMRDGEKAKSLMNDLTKFSDVTPFTAEQVQVAGRGLLAFGFAAEEIIPTLNYLGDAAAGTQKDINELVDILGKIRSKGKLQLEELNRFTERGIVLIPALADILGVAEKDVYKLVSSGKVGFAEVEQALKRLNSEGGIFQGAMENLSTTLSGRLSTFKSLFATTMREVGQILIDAFDVKGSLDGMISYMENSREAIVASVRKIVIVIEYAKTAWAGLQLAGVLALTGLVDISAWLVKGFEVAIEAIATSFRWLWLHTQQGLMDSIGWMIQKIADFLAWMDGYLPESMQTGLGQMAQEFAATYKQIADENRKTMEANDGWIDIDIGGDKAREFADSMQQEANAALKEFMEYASRDISGGAMVDEAKKAAEEIKDAVAAPAMDAYIGKGGLDLAALERGSQQAFSAIMDTQKTMTLEQQQLNEQKQARKILDRIESRGIVLSPANLSRSAAGGAG